MQYANFARARRHFDVTGARTCSQRKRKKKSRLSSTRPRRDAERAHRALAALVMREGRPRWLVTTERWTVSLALYTSLITSIHGSAPRNLLLERRRRGIEKVLQADLLSRNAGRRKVTSPPDGDADVEGARVNDVVLVASACGGTLKPCTYVFFGESGRNRAWSARRMSRALPAAVPWALLGSFARGFFRFFDSCARRTNEGVPCNRVDRPEAWRRARERSWAGVGVGWGGSSRRTGSG